MTSIVCTRNGIEPAGEDLAAVHAFGQYLKGQARVSRKVIGYGKLGRSWNLDPENFSTVGGDVDSYRALKLLAERNPDVDWLLIGRNSGEDPGAVGLPPNVIQFWTEERRSELRERMKGRHAPMKAHEVDAVVSIFDDMTMDTWRNLDGVVVWAGQHGTSNSRILQTGKEGAAGKYTNPQDAFVLYGSYLVRGISVWRNSDPVNREEVWLCSDPRNYLKCRDLKWPLRHPIVSQFEQSRAFKVERYGDLDKYGWENEFEFMPESTAAEKHETFHIWKTRSYYTYDGLELTALPNPNEVPWGSTYMTEDEWLQKEASQRFPFGMIINENRKEVRNPRLAVMKEWVIPNFPGCEIFGKWTPDSIQAMGRDEADVQPIPHAGLFDGMRRHLCTLTTPASGSGWATSKPWECFLNGTICFFHPAYDVQGHIIPLKPNGRDPNADALSPWLRVESPKQLVDRVTYLSGNPSVYASLAVAQRRYVERRYASMQPIRAIERRLGLAQD